LGVAGDVDGEPRVFAGAGLGDVLGEVAAGEVQPEPVATAQAVAELGGSMTLVTHVYANRAEMLRGITERTVAGHDEEIRQLERGGG
jgi:hypothetical protein